VVCKLPAFSEWETGSEEKQSAYLCEMGKYRFRVLEDMQ